MQRVPLNGRNAEYISGEEPALGAALTAAYVRGVQGAGVAAVAKHFTLNQQETYRATTNAVVDARTRWEVYYPPYEAAVRAGAASIMCSYNRVNGVFACGNDQTLSRDLKEGMGFKGWVMSDWWASHSEKDAMHGLDQYMPGNDAFFTVHPSRAPIAPASARLPGAVGHLPAYHAIVLSCCALLTFGRKHSAQAAWT